jgi:hypothetical protein
MNNEPIEVLHENRSFQTFGFSRQIKQATALVEVLLLLAYASAMMLSLSLLFI